MRGIDLTPLVQAVISLAVALITAKVIPWITSKTTRQQQDALLVVVRMLVSAAEQIYGSGQGCEKMVFVKSQLEKHGYTIDPAAIEAAVREMTLEQIKIQ